MAPVNIKYIVSFSSQDDNHRASNLVNGDGMKKWLSNPSDRSGKIEAILQLEQSCNLAYIDIGTIWCASLEIRVGCSDWPQTEEFKPFVSTVNLMTPVDCRLGRGSSVTKMFSKANFSSDTATKKWDRLQIICRQALRKDVQFGVSFIRLKSANPIHGKNVLGKTPAKDMINNENIVCKDVSSIQQHFFSKLTSTNSEKEKSAATLKQRLLKISGTAENGSEEEQSLSRTAKLVLKASENSDARRQIPPSATSRDIGPKRGLFSDHLNKQKAVPIDKEIKMFLPTLNITMADIEKVTVADLRHKFEKKKRRKLTVDEKRIFSRLCEDFICSLLDGPSDDNLGDYHSATVDDRLGQQQDHTSFPNRSGTATPGTKSNPKKVVKEHDNRNQLSESLYPVSSASTLPKKSLNSSENSLLSPSNSSTIKKRLYQVDDDDDIKTACTTPAKQAKHSKASSLRKLKSSTIDTNNKSELVDYDFNGDVKSDCDDRESLSSVSYDEEDNSDSSSGSSPNMLGTAGGRKHSRRKIAQKCYERLYESEIVPKRPCGKQESSDAKKCGRLSYGKHNLSDNGDEDCISIKDKGNNKCEGFKPCWTIDLTPGSGLHQTRSDPASSTNPYTAPNTAVGQVNSPKPNSKGKVYRMLTVSPKVSGKTRRNVTSSGVKQTNNKEEKNGTSGSKARGAGRSVFTAGNQRERASLESKNKPGEMVFCDKCYDEIPSSSFSSHYLFCVQSTVFLDKSHSSNNLNETQNEALLDESVDYAECPICLERFPQDALPVHASECGL